MQPEMFHGLTIFVKVYIMRCDKVRNECHMMPVDRNRNSILII